MIQRLAFAGYRSLRDLTFDLGQLTVITGENGAGKSNVYRALRLLVDAAEGNLGRALAREGGMPSAMWSGDDRPTSKATGGLRLSIGFSDGHLAYELRLGYPGAGPFASDPMVKEETIRTLEKPRLKLLERRNASVMLRDNDGVAQTFAFELDQGESVLSQLAEPHRYPLLSSLRERIRHWRFYHQLRTDADSPLRTMQVAPRTPVMAHDGHDVAAALMTILQSGDGGSLVQAVKEAFDGASLHLRCEGNRFGLGLQVPGMWRPLDAPELSDGQVRYLALLAALYSTRQPELLVLNEPETSLNPKLLAPLAAQIIAASRGTQIIVVSHAERLVDELSSHRGVARIELAKQTGETVIPNRRTIDKVAWKWTS